MRRVSYWVSATLALVLLLSSGQASAQSDKNGFEKFDDFVARTKVTGFDPAKHKAANGAAFEEMRKHVLKLYEGAKVTHSFTVGSQTYDCMPIDQQPAVRLHGLKRVEAAPPAAAPARGAGAAGADGAGAQSGQAATANFPKGADAFGNALGCEDKTVPIGRTTIEQISRFPTLRAFLGKGPDGKFIHRGPATNSRICSVTILRTPTTPPAAMTIVAAPLCNTAAASTWELLFRRSVCPAEGSGKQPSNTSGGMATGGFR